MMAKLFLGLGEPNKCPDRAWEPGAALESVKRCRAHRRDLLLDFFDILVQLATSSNSRQALGIATVERWQLVTQPRTEVP